MNDLLNIGLGGPPNSLEPTSVTRKPRHRKKPAIGATARSDVPTIGLPKSKPETGLRAKVEQRFETIDNGHNQPLGGQGASSFFNKSEFSQDAEFLPGEYPTIEVADASEEEQPRYSNADPLSKELRTKPYSVLDGLSQEPVERMIIPAYGTSTPEQVANEQAAIDEALGAGVSPFEIRHEVIKRRQERGYDQVDVEDVEDYVLDESILQPLENFGPGLDYAGVTDAKADAASLYNTYERYGSILYDIGEIFGSDKSRVLARNASNRIKEIVVKDLRARGANAYYDLDSLSIKVITEDGLAQTVDPGFVDSIVEAMGEATGAIGGAGAGAKAALIAGQIPPLTAVPEEIITVPLAAAIGGFMGASTGAGADYLRNMVQLQQDIDVDLAFGKMIDAGIADVVFGVAAAAGFKGTKKYIGPLANFVYEKGLVRPWNIVRSGNQEEAAATLRKYFRVTEEQSKDITKAWVELLADPENIVRENIFKQKVPLTELQKEMLALVLTRPGGENFTRMMVNVNTQWIKDNSNNAARQLVKATDNLIEEKSGIKLRKNLALYEKTVKETLEGVKQVSSQVIDETGFTFNLPKTTLDKAEDQLRMHLADPVAFSNYNNLMTKLGTSRAARNFSNLMEVRNHVSKFKNKTKNLTNVHFQRAMRETIEEIDKQLYKGNVEHLGEPYAKKWIESYHKALKEYGEMKRHKDNLISKAIMQEGQTEAGIAQTIIKRLPSIDDTVPTFLEKLSKNSRIRVEGLFIRGLIEKHTEKVGQFKALDFPELIEDLDLYEVTNPDVQAFKELAIKYGESMGNDSALIDGAGVIRNQQVMQALTSSWITKAEYAGSARFFSYMMQFIPSKGAGFHSALNNLHTLLDNPYDRKALDSITNRITMHKSDESIQALEDMKTVLLKLQENYAKNATTTKIYYIKPGFVPDLDAITAQFGARAAKKAAAEQTKYSTGKFRKGQNSPNATKGVLGEGYYVKTSLTPEDKTRYPHTVLLSNTIKKDKIADISTVNAVVNKDKPNAHTITKVDIANHPATQKRVVKALKEAGYSAITDGDNVMLFDLPE